MMLVCRGAWIESGLDTVNRAKVLYIAYCILEAVQFLQHLPCYDNEEQLRL